MATNHSFKINLWHPRWWPFLARAVWNQLKRIEIVLSLK